MTTPASLLRWIAALLMGMVVISMSVTPPAWRHVPAILRPSVLVCAASATATFAASFLDPAVAERLVTLRLLEAIGLGMGLLVAPVIAGRERGDRASVGVPLALPKLWALFALFLSAGIVFVATQGAPLLAGNIESGRVEAAASGSGYLRLLAYMTVPVAISLYARRAPRAVLAVLLAAGVVVLLANRSPLVYLFGSLVIVRVLMSQTAVPKSRIYAGAALGLLMILALGTFRIFSQDEFQKYDEYRFDLAEANYTAVTITAANAYIRVVGQNEALVRDLYSSGLLETRFGTTYLNLFITALPGEQLSLDREIRLLSGSSFVGGGIPPTLGGEALVNFGLVGVLIVPFLMVLALTTQFQRYYYHGNAVEAAVYAYLLIWFSGAQVAGLAGASTVPLAGALVLMLLAHLREDKGNSQ